jgi:hypothetical protein
MQRYATIKIKSKITGLDKAKGIKKWNVKSEVRHCQGSYLNMTASTALKTNEQLCMIMPKMSLGGKSNG